MDNDFHLVTNDYTLEDACKFAGDSPSVFLYHCEILARKRGLFFRFSSPLRYMMDCALETLHYFIDQYTKSPIVQLGTKMENSRVTIFKKNSFIQDRTDRERRRTQINLRNDLKRKQQNVRTSLRSKITKLKRKLKRKMKQRRKLESIRRMSLKFQHSKRLWNENQRWRLSYRMHLVSKETFAKMKEAIEYYMPPSRKVSSHELVCPKIENWTMQTCRHISHIIR